MLGFCTWLRPPAKIMANCLHTASGCVPDEVWSDERGNYGRRAGARGIKRCESFNSLNPIVPSPVYTYRPPNEAQRVVNWRLRYSAEPDTGS